MKISLFGEERKMINGLIADRMLKTKDKEELFKLNDIFNKMTYSHCLKAGVSNGGKKDV
jgi:hypothetical protein